MSYRCSTMFVDKVKRTDQNKIEEFKSRGVACQFNAIAGKDFVDKFWHVARDSSINSILAKGTQQGVKLYQFDLPGFYLQSAPDDATFEAAQWEFNLYRRRGVQVERIGRDQLRQMEPALNRDYVDAYLLPETFFTIDPMLLTRRIVDGLVDATQFQVYEFLQ